MRPLISLVRKSGNCTKHFTATILSSSSLLPPCLPPIPPHPPSSSLHPTPLNLNHIASAVSAKRCHHASSLHSSPSSPRLKTYRNPHHHDACHLVNTAQITSLWDLTSSNASEMLSANPLYPIRCSLSVQFRPSQRAQMSMAARGEFHRGWHAVVACPPFADGGSLQKHGNDEMSDLRQFAAGPLGCHAQRRRISMTQDEGQAPMEEGFLTAPVELSLEKLMAEDEGIAVLSLHRPKLRNAIGRNILRQLKHAIETLRFDSMTRVVVLRSVVDGVFCAGADLKERRGMTQVEAQKFVSSLRTAFADLEALPMPTIAVVEGVALGGGLEMALACDLRVAGADAVFGLPETSLAIIPGAGGTQRLPRAIGRSRAKELVFTGRRLSAEEAASLGLVDHAVEAGQAYTRALGIAREIVPRGPVAIRMAKVAIDRGCEVDAATGMAIEESCYQHVLRSEDRLEGLRAFAEKRKPLYKGE